MATRKQVCEALCALVGQDFMADTYIASGHDHVASIILASREAAILLANSSCALAEVLARLEAGLPEDDGAVPLFVLLGELGTEEALPHLCTYLRTLPEEEAESAVSPWHPFWYAIRALEHVTGLRFGLESSSDLRGAYSRRQDIADHVCE